MYFNANLTVTINGQTATSIVSVKTSNDASKVGASAEVIVPLNSYFQYSDPNTKFVYLTAIRYDSFPQGVPINITASYDGFNVITIFSGFVYDSVLSMPLTIKCYDYVYFFNLGIFGDKQVAVKNKAGTKIKNSGTGVNYPSVMFQDLLQQLVAFTNTQIDLQNVALGLNTAHCELILPTVNFELVNLTFIHMSCAAILEYFKKNLGFNITFFANKLYVNLASNTVGSINLNTGINVIKSDLQTNLAAFQQIRLKAWYVTVSGKRSYVEVGATDGIQVENHFYNIPDNSNQAFYLQLANEALLQAEQHHYHGSLELLLYPQCDLFYIVYYTDLRYPAKSGKYTIIGQSFDISEKGFHCNLKLAFLDTALYKYLTGQPVQSAGNTTS